MTVLLQRGKEKIIRRQVTGDCLSPQYYLTLGHFSGTERFTRKLLAAPPEPVLKPGTFLFFGVVTLYEPFKGGIGELLPPQSNALTYRHLAELVKPEQFPEQYDKFGQLPKRGELIVSPMMAGAVTLKYTCAQWHFDDPDEESVSLPERTRIIYLKPPLQE
ncbi:MAG TPA: hypothetical protein VEA36_02975 [Candidatus Paceibacterota bacterium]|nr:hypothetical protein [Candidatus Paceibacterota bacterium]